MAASRYLSFAGVLKFAEPFFKDCRGRLQRLLFSVRKSSLNDSMTPE
jgi:hypothetical protein